MKKSFLYSFLFLVSVSTICSAQTASQIDSLKQLLSSPPNDSLAGTWNNLLFNLYRPTNLDSALYFGEKAQKIAESTQNKTLLAHNKNSFGAYHWRKGEYKIAMEHYITSASIFESLGNDNEAAMARFNIATLYLTLGDFQKAVPYCKSAIDVYKSSNEHQKVADFYNVMGILVFQLGQPDSSIYYFEKSLASARKGDYALQESRAISSLGEVFMTLGKNEKAKEYLLESLKLEEKLGNEDGILQSYIQLGDFEFRAKNFEKAQSYYQKAETHSYLQNTFYIQQMLYGQYVKLYEGLGNIPKAYDYYKKMVAAKDSVASSEDKAFMNELNEKYETERKENEILSLQNEKRSASLILEQEKNKNLILILASVFMLGAVGFISVVYMQTKKRKEEVDEKNEVITHINEELKLSEESLHQLNKTKDHFFAVISHDLRGPVASFQGISKILQYQIKKNNTERVNDLMAQVDKNASQLNILLDNLLKWAQSQLGGLSYKPQPISVKNLAEEIEQIYEAMAQSKQVQTRIEVTPPDLQAFADSPSTATILRNLWGNALKFTENGTLSLQAKAEGGQVHIIMEDTGTGISEEKLANIFEINQSKSNQGTQGEKGNGLGLVLCREFAERNGGKIEMESEIGKGTKVHLWLPVFGNHPKQKSISQ